jgi:hypothetical protein
MNRILKLKIKHWWHNADLLHYTAIVLLGFVLACAIIYALAIMLAPIIQPLNSH